MKLFTANPLNDRRDQMLINASWGLGEAIVGGEVTPDQWTVKGASGDIEEVRISSKEFMIVRKDSGTYTERVPEELRNKPVLYEGMASADNAIKEITASVRKRKGRRAANRIKALLQSYREVGGLRERPKYDIVRTIAVFRDILLGIGKELKRKSTPRLVASTGESIYSLNEEEGPNTLTGIPVSSGVYEGRVRIVESLNNARLDKGEILVTRATDPAWTPLFLNAGALIMESGGPLSHGTVVAREYGIPAVVGIKDACKRLKNGQMVRVNGESGQIVLMSQDCI